MFCPHCGGEIEDEGARFCPNCGRSLAGMTVPGMSPPGGATVAGQMGRMGQAGPLGPGAELGTVTVGTVTRPLGKTVQTEAGGFELAGFGIRFGGWLVDVAVYFVAAFAIGFVAGIVIAVSGGDPAADDDAASNALNAILFFASIGATWTFNSIGWSPGKRAVGLRIINDRGTPPGAGAGLGRTLGSWLSGLAIGLGYLWAAWDDKNQTWHDKMASTFVVRVR